MLNTLVLVLSQFNALHELTNFYRSANLAKTVVQIADLHQMIQGVEPDRTLMTTISADQGHWKTVM